MMIPGSSDIMDKLPCSLMDNRVDKCLVHLNAVVLPHVGLPYFPEFHLLCM